MVIEGGNGRGAFFWCNWQVYFKKKNVAWGQMGVFIKKQPIGFFFAFLTTVISSLYSDEKDHSLATITHITHVYRAPLLIIIPQNVGLINGFSCDMMTFCLSCRPVLFAVAIPFSDMVVMLKGPVQLLWSFPPFRPSFLLLAFKHFISTSLHFTSS